MTHFVPGAELSRLFYLEAVQPILQSAFPDLRYAAARIDSGSDVLGFDTAQSTDHDWGPRLQILLDEEDARRHGSAIPELLAKQLPFEFHGYSTHFGTVGEDGSRLMEPRSAYPIAHRVEVHSLRAFFAEYLAINTHAPLEVLDWLTLPEQRLLTITAGPVFHDGYGELTRLRKQLEYYPHDVWLYLLAAQWQRISQEEPFVGRTGDVGDELGSQVITARLVRDVMKLGFLMERRYAPYSKWFGTAFSRLSCAPAVEPSLRAALAAQSWQEREGHLAEAYSQMATLHNGLGITPPLETQAAQFYNRPYRVINAGRFVAAIRAGIQNPVLHALPIEIGGVDQYINSTELLTRPWLLRQMRAIYEISLRSM